jgi:hypothetical protein
VIRKRTQCSRMPDPDSKCDGLTSIPVAVVGYYESPLSFSSGMVASTLV